jgi:hypothetical protein
MCLLPALLRAACLLAPAVPLPLLRPFLSADIEPSLARTRLKVASARLMKCMHLCIQHASQYTTVACDDGLGVAFRASGAHVRCRQPARGALVAYQAAEVWTATGPRLPHL